MLDEKLEKDKCIARLKVAFEVGLKGDKDGAAEAVRTRMAERGLLKDGNGGEGDGLVKMEEEADEPEERRKGEKKRVREGNTSLDAFVKRVKKE
jgi:cryptochrome